MDNAYKDVENAFAKEKNRYTTKNVFDVEKCGVTTEYIEDGICSKAGSLVTFEKQLATENTLAKCKAVCDGDATCTAYTWQETDDSSPAAKKCWITKATGLVQGNVSLGAADTKCYIKYSANCILGDGAKE